MQYFAAKFSTFHSVSVSNKRVSAKIYAYPRGSLGEPGEACCEQEVVEMITAMRLSWLDAKGSQDQPHGIHHREEEMDFLGGFQGTELPIGGDKNTYHGDILPVFLLSTCSNAASLTLSLRFLLY
jgi:hypothetical protein